MIEVSVDVILVYLVKPSYLVYSFASDSIAFEDSDVEISTESEGLKVLASYHDTSSAYERVVDIVTCLNLTLICH